MARLGVNVDNVAVLRNVGGGNEADPVKAAMYAEIGGCDGIVCTLRKGLKPISERDLKILREMVTTHLNIRVPSEDRLLNAALSARPDMITIIADRQVNEFEPGCVDILGHPDKISAVIDSIRAQDIVVSVLIEPEILQVKAAAKAGADYVEFHLKAYTEAKNLHDKADCLENLSMVAMAAVKLGLGTSAGNGLNYANIQSIASIEKIEELNVGAAVVGRSLWIGMEAAVRDLISYIK